MDIKEELTELLKRAIEETANQEYINANTLKTLIQAEKELCPEKEIESGVVLLPAIIENA